jgi:hypothetical protein
MTRRDTAMVTRYVLQILGESDKDVFSKFGGETPFGAISVCDLIAAGGAAYRKVTDVLHTLSEAGSDVTHQVFIFTRPAKPPGASRGRTRRTELQF